MDASLSEPSPVNEAVAAARGSGLNVAGAAFNGAVRLLITLSIARLLGDTQVGLYYLAIAVHDLLALVASGGFQAALTRFVAARLADGDEAGLRGLLRIGRAVPVGLACALALVLAAASSWLGTTAFEDERLIALFRYAALALPATVFVDVTLAATRGYRTMRPFVSVGLVFMPGIRLALTFLAIRLDAGIEGALVALVVANYLAACVAFVWARRITGRPSVDPRYDRREIFSFALLSWASMLAIDAFIWADTILIGLFRPPADVGIYQVASRLVLLSAIFIMPVTQAVAPRIADLFQRGRLDALRSLYVTVTSWVLRLVILPTIILVLFPTELLVVFGRSFATGATVTVILAIGALVHATTGPSGAMLNMTGRPGWALGNNAATVAVNVGMNLVLIPRYGITGAAFAWALSLLFTNVLVAWQIHRALKVHPFGVAFVRSLIAALPALAVGVVADAVMEGRGGFLLAAAAVTVTYIGTVWALGLTRDDQEVWDQVTRRFRRPVPASE